MRFLRASIAVLMLLGAACDGKVLPDFDGGLLNPEFRFLRAGDVVNGVKCAMVAFMLEREHQLIEQREKHPKIFDAIETKINVKHPNESVYFRPHQLGTTNEPLCKLGQHWEKAGSDKCPRQSPGCCVANACKDGALGTPLWDYTVPKGTNPKPKGCVPVPDYSRFALDQNQSATITFSLNATNSGFISYARIDATRLDGLYPKYIVPGGGAAGNPFPQMLPTVKGTTTFEMAVLMPQSLYSAPAVRPQIPEYERSEGYSIREIRALAEAITLTDSEQRKAANTRQAIKTRRTTAAETLEVEPENNAKTSLLDLELRRWNTIAREMRITARTPTETTAAVDEFDNNVKALQDMSDKAALLPQRDPNSDPFGTAVLIGEIKNINNSITNAAIKNKVERLLQQARPRVVQVARVVPVPDSTPTAETFSPQALAARAKKPALVSPVAPALEQTMSQQVSTKENREFASRCVSDRYGFQIGEKVYIDYLALKRMLQNVVDEQNEKLHDGGPPVTLESLTLSSMFQVTLEVQAGTNHIFRIVPLLAAPNTELKGDHAHTLKMVLKGAKKKGDPFYSTKLVASCKQRLQDNNAPEQIARCASLEGLMLEAITESLENNGG